MRAILPGSKWRCLLLHIALIDALSEVMKVYPYMKLKVFVDDNTVFMEGRNVGRNCGTGAKGDEKGTWRRKGLKLSITKRERRKE